MRQNNDGFAATCLIGYGKISEVREFRTLYKGKGEKRTIRFLSCSIMIQFGGLCDLSWISLSLLLFCWVVLRYISSMTNLLITFKSCGKVLVIRYQIGQFPQGAIHPVIMRWPIFEGSRDNSLAL